jgi:predicted signal transduction protein with EAL and GGDEF domain
VGASVGISVYPQDGHDAETLLRMADIAMQRAKQERVANPDDSVAFYSLDMNRACRSACASNPACATRSARRAAAALPAQVFEIGSGKMVGAEALVRWRIRSAAWCRRPNSSRWPKPPGLIVQVGEWVLEAGLRAGAVWQRAGLPPFRLAVNVSAREFTSLAGRVARR